MANITKDRIDYIDQLKGFTILLVIIGHLSYFCWQDVNSFIFKWLASFEMPLFIFLSGLMAYKSMSETLFKFLIKKVVTLLFPFFFIGAIYSYVVTGSTVDFLTSGEMHLGYWFTWSLFWIFIIHRIFSKLYLWIFKVDNLLKESLYWCAIILLFHVIRKISIIPDALSVIFSTNQLFSYFQYFIGGILITKYVRLRDWIFSKYGFLIALIVYWIVFFLIKKPLFSNFIGYSIWGICGVIVMVYYFKVNDQILVGGDYLKKLGRRSLDIYVLHYFVLRQLPLKQYASTILGNGLLFELSVSIILSLIIASCCMIISSMIRTSPLLGCILLGDWNFVKCQGWEERLFENNDLKNNKVESIV